MKSSTVLLIAVFLLVAGAIAAGVVFLMPGSGTLVVPGGGDGGTSTVRPVKPRDGDGKRPRHPRGTDDSPPIKIARGEHVRGTVQDAEGNPVVDASVRIHLPAGTTQPAETRRDDEIRRVIRLFMLDLEDVDRPRRFEDFVDVGAASQTGIATGEEVGSATTDDEGKFDAVLARSVVRGPLTVVAHKDGVGHATSQGVQVDETLLLVLGQPLTAGGQVLTMENSVPVPGARVILDDGTRRFAATADDDGRFEIAGVVPGYYMVDVVAEGRTPLLASKMHVAPGVPVELRLPLGTTLRVQVVGGDEIEIPIEGADVVLFEERNYTYRTGTTGPQGYVSFPGLPDGPHLVNVEVKGYASLGEEQVVIKGGGVQDLSLWVEQTVATPITMVDEEGRPVPDVQFFTANWDEEYDDLTSERVPGQTDGRGQFKFAFEFDGPRGALFAFKKGFAMTYVYAEEYDIGEPVRFVMRKAIRVHGRVTTPSGKPVPSAWVYFEVTPEDEDALDDLAFRVRTKENGTYDFQYVPLGTIFIGAETDYDWSDEEEIVPVPGKTDYQIDLVVEVDEE